MVVMNLTIYLVIRYTNHYVAKGNFMADGTKKKVDFVFMILGLKNIRKLLNLLVARLK